MVSDTVGVPEPSEYAEWYRGYVALAAGSDILALLAEQVAAVRQTFGNLTPTQERHRYAPGKWSVRQVLGHVIDAERVFGYRAVSFARGSTANLPGFDENAWAEQARADECEVAGQLDEFEHLRLSHVAMFRHLPAETWRHTGVANTAAVSVRALAFIMAGHLAHHLAILRERYGIRPAS